MVIGFVGGGLSIGAGVAYFVGAAAAGPLGWAALAVTGIGILGSYFFKSRDKKEHEARTRLENNLKITVLILSISRSKPSIRTDTRLLRFFSIWLCKEEHIFLTFSFRLADTQRELAWGLNEHQLEMNGQIVTEGIRLIGAEGLQYHVQSVARSEERRVGKECDRVC